VPYELTRRRGGRLGFGRDAKVMNEVAPLGFVLIYQIWAPPAAAKVEHEADNFNNITTQHKTPQATPLTQLILYTPEHTARMILNYQVFNETFAFDPQCAYNEIAIQKIEGARSELEGLFFEKVLKDLGIKRRKKCSISCTV
jgi:hypothetical protein